MAALIDFTIILLLWSLILIPAFIFLDKEIITSTPLVSTSVTAAFIAIFMLYYTGFLGTKAATPGGLFFGYMLVRDSDGSEVLMFRSFCFSLFLLLFWWLAPLVIFVTPANRTLHEYLVGCRVIHTRKRKSSKK